MGADRHQWQFPKNEADKVLGWRSNGKGLENKDWVSPADIAGKQDADPNLDALSSATTTLGTTGLAVLGAEGGNDALNAIDSKLYGASSVSRTVFQRFGDVVDLDDWLVGDGSTNNDTAFDALLTYMAANPGKTYRSRNGRVYACGFSAKTIPATARLRLEGAKFLWDGDLSASSNSILTLEDGADFDALRFEIETGALFRRAIDMKGCRGDLVELIAQTQIANGGGSNLDYAARVIGGENRLGEIKVKNIDQAACLYGSLDFAAGTRIGFVDIESYTTGLMCRDLKENSIGGYLIRERSANGTPDPGQNSILLSGVADMVFGPGVAKDAPEHGIRVGGTYTGGVDTERVTFNSPMVFGAGQCGFKAYAGLTQPLSHLSVIGGQFIDSGNDGDGLGFNDFGMMIQNCVDSSFVGCEVGTQNLSYSGYDSVYVSAANRINLEGIRTRNAFRNGLHISEYSGGGATDPADCNSLTVSDFHSEFHGSEGVYLQFAAKVVRDMFITNAHLMGGTDGVKTDASASRFSQPSYISAFVRGQSDAKFNVTATANLKTVDMTV